MGDERNFSPGRNATREDLVRKDYLFNMLSLPHSLKTKY